MACNHGGRFKAYRRGPAPSYPFLPAGEICPKCLKWLPPEPKPSTNEASPNLLHDAQTCSNGDHDGCLEAQLASAPASESPAESGP